jgi:3-demethylubiquinone-9 3-methyltransferase
MAKNTICLWYDKDAEVAARFYAATFPDSAVGAIHRAPSRFIRDLGPKGWRQPANSDHVYKSGDQYDPGGEHEDFVKFEARN